MGDESYKLVYFDLRGIAEPIRYLFGYLGIPFEDHLVDCTTWYDVKHEFKWQQLPELHIKRSSGTKMLTESCAITRYLCNKYQPGLVPKDPFLSARCDQIVESIQDLRIYMKPYAVSKAFTKDGKAEEIKKDLFANQVPIFFSNLNEILLDIKKDCGDTGDFILGKDLSWADFWLAHIPFVWGEIFDEPDWLKPYPALQKQQDAFMAISQIKERNEKRPNMIF